MKPVAERPFTSCSFSRFAPRASCARARVEQSAVSAARIAASGLLASCGFARLSRVSPIEKAHRRDDANVLRLSLVLGEASGSLLSRLLLRRGLLNAAHHSLGHPICVSLVHWSGPPGFVACFVARRRHSAWPPVVALQPPWLRCLFRLSPLLLLLLLLMGKLYRAAGCSAADPYQPPYAARGTRSTPTDSTERFEKMWLVSLQRGDRVPSVAFVSA